MRLDLSALRASLPALQKSMRFLAGVAPDAADLDLVLVSNEPISLVTLGALHDAFSESDLPYRNAVKLGRASFGIGREGFDAIDMASIIAKFVALISHP